MSEYEAGRSAVHSIMTGQANETVTFLRGYASDLKAHQISPVLFGIDDTKAVPADENDPDGYSLGIAASRAERILLAEQSAEFQAGFSYELNLPITDRAKALANRAAVEHRAAELYAEHKTVAALVEYKLAMMHDPNQKSVQKPRTPDLDARELAYIAALKHAKEVRHRADQIVQATKIAKGEGEFVGFEGDAIVPRAFGTVLITPEERLAYFAKTAPTNLEFRDGPVGS
jgi:hypothetical protein